MTNKETLLSAIKLNKTERVPVIILTSGVWTYSRIGLSLQDSFDITPEKAAEYIIQNNRELNLDLIWTAADCNNIALRAIGAKTTFDIIGSAATIDEPLIAEPGDVDKLKIEDIEKDPGIDALLQTTKIIAERDGEEYLLGVSQWGPLTLAGQMMGIETFMRTLLRDPEGAKHILGFTQKLILKYWNLFLEAGAELVCMSEPSASGDMISSRVFEKLALPYIQKTFDGVQPAAKMLHICGNTTKILDFIPQTGAQLFSMDYKVDLKYAKEKLGGKIAFAGQIDPVGVMLNGSVHDVESASHDCIQAAGDDGGYILMPGCDLPPKTKIENVLTMVNAAHQMRL